MPSESGRIRVLRPEPARANRPAFSRDRPGPAAASLQAQSTMHPSCRMPGSARRQRRKSGRTDVPAAGTAGTPSCDQARDRQSRGGPRPGAPIRSGPPDAPRLSASRPPTARLHDPAGFVLSLRLHRTCCDQAAIDATKGRTPVDALWRLAIIFCEGTAPAAPAGPSWSCAAIRSPRPAQARTDLSPAPPPVGVSADIVWFEPVAAVPVAGADPLGPLLAPEAESSLEAELPGEPPGVRSEVSDPDRESPDDLARYSSTACFDGTWRITAPVSASRYWMIASPSSWSNWMNGLK